MERLKSLLRHIGFRKTVSSNIDKVYTYADYVVVIYNHNFRGEIIFYNRDGDIDFAIHFYNNDTFVSAIECIYDVINKHFNMLPENRQDRITKLYDDKRD